jgi:hypothetical protein
MNFKAYISMPFIMAIALFLSTAIAKGPDNDKEKDDDKDKKGVSYQLALIGDFPYTLDQEEKWLRVRDEINHDKAVEFTIFDGDIKSGSTRCTDSLFNTRLDQFNTFKNPFIYIFGDNEWTDCHRSNNGSYDPLERLDKLRSVFTQGNNSQGRKTFYLERQSEKPGFHKFRENIRGHLYPVYYIGLNIPGSNNNFGRTPAMDIEYAERNKANLVWLREGFAEAKRTKQKGIMIVIQANPGFELAPTDPNRTGYNDFLLALKEETLAFSGQVVLVHGDSHNFQIDKPMLLGPNLPSVPNFTRVETFGSPNVHWIKVYVNSENPNVFGFDQQIVVGN